MSEYNLERLDDLIIDNMKIYQRTDQFRFSIDAILLAHFPKYKGKGRYVELGTGTGVIPLVATSLGAGHVTGIEINPVTAELAERSVRYNHKKQQVEIICCDYRTMTLQALKSGGQSLDESCSIDTNSQAEKRNVPDNLPFDGVLINPPYYGTNTGHVSVSSDVAKALHEGTTMLGEALESAKKLVKFRGYCWMIYTAERLAYALDQLKLQQFEVKRMRFVHSFHHSEAKLVLIEAMQGGKPGMTVEAPLVIYKEQNVYSEEVASWYGR